jgi:aminopeptidase N
VTVAAALLFTVASAAPAAAQFTPGAAGLGDPFFPDAGNGGYDVSAYDPALDYSPKDRHLEARAQISSVATQDLSSFALDFRRLQVDRLTVDGVDASYTRSGQELTVVPVTGIPTGASFIVVVDYSGRPKNVIDPDGSKDGWINTDDGVFVASEPQGAPTWFPCNDYPTDKAAFAISITVPKGVEAISNGALISRRRDGAKRTWSYRTTEPMAT